MSRISAYFGFHDKTFYRNIMRLSIPLMIQQMITTAMFLVDNVMVGTLGDTALAAVTLANQVSFVMQFLIVGLTAAASSFISQYWGVGDIANIRKALGITVLCSEVVAVVFMLAGFFGRHTIMGILSPDPLVQQLGVEYLEIACFIYPIMVLTMSYGSGLRATENVKLPTVSGIIAICTNTFLNYCLIGGNLGFPMMGVRGAAMATLVGSTLDMLIQVGGAYLCKTPLSKREYRLITLDKKYFLSFFKVAYPMMMNEGVWALSASVITAIIAQISTAAAAAGSVFGTIGSLSMVAFAGLGTSCMVLVAKELGQGKMEAAFEYGRRFLRIAPVIGLTMAIVICTVGPLMLTLYDLSEEAMRIIDYRFLFYLISSPIGAYVYTIIVGIQRAGGDSKYMFFLDAGSSWVLGVGVTALLAFVFRVPAEFVCLGDLASNLGKFALGRRRFKSGKWMNNLTEQ